MWAERCSSSCFSCGDSPSGRSGSHAGLRQYQRPRCLFCHTGQVLPGHFQTTWFADTIVWGLRLHRILLAIVGGIGLAVAGAVMQGILKNPLASPFTLGISSAASFGAALAIVLGAGFAGGEWLIIGNAFVFTLLASFTVYGLTNTRA